MSSSNILTVMCQPAGSILNIPALTEMTPNLTGRWDKAEPTPNISPGMEPGLYPAVGWNKTSRIVRLLHGYYM
jgi:hypothetical protein